MYFVLITIWMSTKISSSRLDFQRNKQFRTNLRFEIEKNN